MSHLWKRLKRLLIAWTRFPLLTKELTEAANRRRTYILRIVYAVLLYGVFALAFPRVPAFDESPDYSLFSFGHLGTTLFRLLLTIQCAGVVLFLPALMSGRITQEKERDSLVLLLLTELSPWKIVLEKYFSGLVLMLSFFFLGLPLVGVAYSYGGLALKDIGWLSLSLVILCLQVGAYSLFCSAWCRTTVGSFLSTYLLGTLLYFGPLVLVGLTIFLLDLRHLDSLREYHFLLLCPPLAVFGNEGYSQIPMALALAPSTVSIFVFLGLTRFFLVRRAFLPPANFGLRLFERIDRWMKYLNRVTGGLVFWHGNGTLPGDEPIFWRETERRILGRPHYLIRVLYAIEAPTVLLVLALASTHSGASQVSELSVLLLVIAVLVILIIGVQAANSIVTERVGQNLEVLLTTPLSARAIVHQKERALRRMLYVAAAPLLTVVLCKFGLERQPGYLVCSILLIVIYLPLVSWLALWISLRVRTRYQAILGTVGVLAAWVALCPLLFYLFADHPSGDPVWKFYLLLSPASVPALNEMNDWSHPWDEGSLWILVILNAVLYAGVAFFIRIRLFVYADRYLRR